MPSAISHPPALMVQGTGSHVGKSVLVAGLCRALLKRGLRPAPFKPQNMSNNAAVAADGGEIGRAQALQARAAGRAPSVHMNPVLLKPESDTGAQVIVQGRREGTLKARNYATQRTALLPRVLASFAIVGSDADVVVVEGAGSPAEVNLRAGDIANMGFAESADVPVVLVGDIDRGGVIASLVGTHAVLPPSERARVRGFIVNKFRGDAALFADGVREIETRTGWPCLGVVPWFDRARQLPAEDVLGLVESANPNGQLTIAVPALSRIANFDDLDPLRAEPNVSVHFVQAGEPIPVADVILLPGTKATIADLKFIRAQGWDIDIAAHRRRGGRVVGICGGYQLLGRTIADPSAIEGPGEAVAGLGLLDVETVLVAAKTTRAVTGRHLDSGAPVTGYEIHLGQTSGPDRARPLFEIGGELDGAQSPDGLVMGTYVHGAFTSDEFRRAFLASLGARSAVSYDALVEETLDALASHLEACLDIDRLLVIAGYDANATKIAAATTSKINATFAPR